MTIWESQSFSATLWDLKSLTWGTVRSNSRNIGSFLTEAAVNWNWGEESKTFYSRPSSFYGPSDSIPYTRTFLKRLQTVPAHAVTINSKTPVPCMHKITCKLLLLCGKRLNPIYHTDPLTEKKVCCLALIQQIPLSREDLLYLMAVHVLLIWDLKYIPWLSQH